MKLVAVGILFVDGKVLACQRKRDARYPLKWEFPGGKVEIGETPEAAVVRELREELAIEAVVEYEFCRQDWTYSAGMPGSTTENAYRVFYFMIRKFTGTPVNLAFEKIQWVTPDDLEAMDILDGNRAAVDLLVSLAHQGPQHRVA